jgi:hypothetical protein
MPAPTISINRAPVLTLWAAVVAKRLGFDEDEALSLGKALAGLNAQAKGRRLGIPGEGSPGHGYNGSVIYEDRPEACGYRAIGYNLPVQQSIGKGVGKGRVRWMRRRRSGHWQQVQGPRRTLPCSPTSSTGEANSRSSSTR